MPRKATRRSAATSSVASQRAPREQAADHRRTRAERRTEITEDYVELIADLIDTAGEARVVDIAARLGVSHVTVNKTIARLQRDGYATNKPYRSIFLTPQGRELAGAVRRRHEIVIRFLRCLGVSEAAALADAEGIEHHVSPETLAAFERFVSQQAPRES